MARKLSPNTIKKFEKDKKVKGYLLDLRNNPGGLLNQAINITDFFLNDGEIVSTKGRKISETRKFFARRGDEIDGKPIVVLINNGSASASEIFAGALKDHKRAIILGENSYGKGSVQSIITIKKWWRYEIDNFKILFAIRKIYFRGWSNARYLCRRR